MNALVSGSHASPPDRCASRSDGTFAPDHLAVMAGFVLRARANMVELRSILDR